MTDGMMEAYRDNERTKAEERLFDELVKCVADLQRPDATLLELARAVDDVRGGMIGSTSYETRMPTWREKLIKGDETEWIRFLNRLQKDQILVYDEEENLYNLYDKAKPLSPFASDIVFFSYPNGSRELAELARRALISNGYSAQMDDFAYILTFNRRAKAQLRPIWIRATTHYPGQKRRLGPHVSSN